MNLGDRTKRDACEEQVQEPIHALASLNQDDYARGFILAALSSGAAIPQAVMDALCQRASAFQADAGFFDLLFKGLLIAGVEDGELTWGLSEAGKAAGAQLPMPPTNGASEVPR